MRILAIHDRPGWSMDHHCQDLKQVLRGRCDIDIVSCGKKWEQFAGLMASIDPSYDRIYVAGELLGQCVLKAAPEHLRAKVLLGVHSFFLWDGGKSVGAAVARGSSNPEFVAALASSSGVAVICKTLRDAFPEVRTHLTHYGINTELFHLLGNGPADRKRLRAGWVGALLPHKNHRIFEEIREQMSGVVDFEDLVISPDIYFRGESGVLTREEMNRFYNRIDVLIVTADSEGGPLPPMEGSASGVPVITPAVGCMPEFVRHGVDGFLTESYDAEEFIRLLRLLSENREILRSMREACMEKAFGPWSLTTKSEPWFEFLSAPYSKTR